MMNTKPYSINLLMRQYRDIGQNCDKIHQIELVGNNVHEWNVWFRGPPGTLYEGGLFKVNLKYPDDYPEHPPVMRFMNEMWHPNIFKDGRVCISMLHPNDDKDADPDEKPSERWRPCITAEQIFDAVMAMLSSPNPSSPANMEADIQYKFDNPSYEAKVKHLVKKTLEEGTACPDTFRVPQGFFQEKYFRENLEIREDLLLLNSLPLVINEGRINRIKISIPSLFKNISMRMDIEDVEIHVRLLVEQRNFDDIKQNMYKKDGNQKSKSIWAESFKQRKLKDWENKMKKYFKRLAPPTWAKKIIDNIMKNIIISIKNVTIYYESFSLLNMPSLAKVTLDELNINTTDENWFPAFSSGSGVLFRQILFSRLSVTLNLNKNYQPYVLSNEYREKFEQEFLTRHQSVKLVKGFSGFSAFSHTTERPKINYERLKMFLMEGEDFLEKEYIKLRENDTYLLFPIDATIKIKQYLDLSKDFSSTSQNSIWIETKKPLIFMLNKNHMRYLGSLNEHIRVMNIVKRNIHLRPSESPIENPLAWWVYAVKAINEEQKTIKSLTRNTANLLKMRRYIDIYKRKQTIIHVPWLPRATGDEKALLKTIEDQLPLQKLLDYREWAFIEIRIEAKKFSNSNQGVQRLKPLIDIWSNAINNEAAFNNKYYRPHGTIRLTPQEQSDLYEILALDKNKVLDSYLKGINSDPKDIVKEFSFNIHSLYCLITEPKEESTKVMIDADRFKISSVRDWWLKDKEPSLTNHEPIIRSFPNIEGFNVTTTKSTVPTEKALKSDLFLQTPKNTLIEIPEENHGGVLSDSKYSVQSLVKDIPDLDLSRKSESYIEHLKDVGRERDSNDVFIEIDEKEKTPETFEEKFLYFDLKPSSTQWWNQNLILLIEIISLTCGLRNYKSGRFMTHKALEMKSIMVSTAMNLSKAMKDRDDKNEELNEPFNFRLKYQTLFKNIFHYDYNTVVQIQHAGANPLLKFLRENNCHNFASFLETYDKDRKSNGVHVIDDIHPYKPFFNRHHSMFIDFPTDISLKFHEATKIFQDAKEAREKALHEAYNSLKVHITKNLMPSFLFSYGALVLPLILHVEPGKNSIKDMRASHLLKQEQATLHKLKRYPTAIQRWNIMNLFSKKAPSQTIPEVPLVNNQSVLSFTFDMQGAKCQFRIEKIDMHKEKGKGEEPRLNCNVVPREPDLSSGITLNLAPLTIYLSTESFKPLVIFFKNFNIRPAHKAMEKVQKPEEEEMFSVEEYQKIMQCIDYNKREQPKCAEHKRVDINAEFKRVSFEVSNFRSHYIHERKLNLHLNDFTLEIREPENPEGAIDTEIKKLKAHYKKIALDIGNIEIVESFYDNEKYNNIVLLKTKLVSRVYHCIFDNHPLYTDKKIHLLVPYFNLHIDDNLVLFCELIQLYKKGSILQKKKKNVLPRNTPIIEMGENQKNKLANRLHTLLKDHKSGNKNCKHCILRYKKSSLVMNVFIGDLTKNIDVISDTAFTELVSSSSNDLEKGSGLLVTIKHSLTRKQNSFHNTILHLPFLVLTKDMGFFKDNVTIHCSEALPVLVNPATHGPKLLKEAIISKFRPGVRAKKNCLAMLDEKFWSYFRHLEIELSIPKAERVEIEEIVEEDEEDSHDEEERLIDLLPTLKRFTTLPDRIIFDKEAENFFNSAQSLYVLFLSKKYLRRELLKDFDIGKRKKEFNDYITFRLKELSVSFNSLSSFSSIVNTLDAFGQINKWLGQFIMTCEFKSNLSTSSDDSLDPFSDEPTAIDELQKTLRTMNLSLSVDKINFSVDCDLPNHKIGLEINKVSFENSHNQKNILDRASMFKRPVWDLFSIENIRVQTSVKGFGLFEKISLKYHEFSKELKFSINKIYYNCPSKLQESLLSIPKVYMAKNPKINPKALDVCFVFKNRLLTAINIIVSPVDLYLSDIDLIESLSSLTLLNAYRNQIKAETTQVLGDTVFERHLFDRIQNDLIELQRILPKKIKRRNPKKPKLGPFVADPNMLIAVLMENLSIKFAKDHTTFANLGIMGAKFETELDGNYRAEIEDISLQPYDSSYQDIFSNMIKDKPMYTRVYKQDGQPVFHFENCKVIYISRTIKELMKFNKEITAELQNVANHVLDLSLKSTSQIKIQSSDKEEKPYTAPFKFLFEESCLALPRDSKSKDVLIIMGKMTQLTFGKEIRFVEVPSRKTSIISVNEKTRTANTIDVMEKIKAKVNLMNVVISGTQISYAMGQKRLHLADSQQTTMIIATPSARTTNGTWNYESTLDMSLDDFNISLNAVAMEEAKKIMGDNFKESSEIYQLRTDNRFNIRLKYAGQDAGLGITRNRIPGDIVRAFIEMREQRERNRKRPNTIIGGAAPFGNQDEDKENIPNKANLVHQNTVI